MHFSKEELIGLIFYIALKSYFSDSIFKKKSSLGKFIAKKSSGE